MKCPRCESSSYRKNGWIKGRQRYLCKICGRQFLQQITLTVNGEQTSQQIRDASELDSPANVGAKVNQNGMAILLLDAENIRLDVDTENFIYEISSLPLQVKIAFANWRTSSMAKRDGELHQRGYQLIHVPGGSNSADGKMIAVGSSIFLQYPNVEEIFICSNDLIFTHLCTELQNRGLIIHRVYRENNCLKVDHRHTGTISSYSFALNSSIPSLDKIIKSLEEIIHLEYNSAFEIKNRLSDLANLWQERKKNPWQSLFNSELNLDNNTVLNFELNNNKAIDLSGNNQNGLKEANASNNTIQSEAQLEQAIIAIVQQHQTNSPHQELSLTTVSHELKKTYGESGSEIVKRLKLKSSFTKFIRASQLFTAEKSGSTYKITLAVNEQVIFDNPQSLEQNLLKLLQDFLAKSQLKSIQISRLSDEFKKRHGLPISTILKQLNLKKSFLSFLQSCSVFKVQKSGKVYYVTISSLEK